MNFISNKLWKAVLLALVLLTQSACMASKMVSDAVEGPALSKTENPPEPPVENPKNYWAALGYVVAIPVDIVTFPIQAIFAGILVNNAAKEMNRMDPSSR